MSEQEDIRVSDFFITKDGKVGRIFYDISCQTLSHDVSMMQPTSRPNGLCIVRNGQKDCLLVSCEDGAVYRIKINLMCHEDEGGPWYDLQIVLRNYRCPIPPNTDWVRSGHAPQHEDRSFLHEQLQRACDGKFRDADVIIHGVIAVAVFVACKFHMNAHSTIIAVDNT
jgi:hypothetical protein